VNPSDTGGAAAWAELPYEAVRERAARDGSVLVVPVGSLEQHGAHLPTGTDALLVRAVVDAAVEELDTAADGDGGDGDADATDDRDGDADEGDGDVPLLVTPPIWTGHSPHHLPFGGTVSLDHDDLMATLEGVVETALENGFDALVLVNGHGGNAATVASATGTVGAAHPDVEVVGLTYFDLGGDRIDALRETDVGGAGHAGEVETALLYHLRPDLVDVDVAEGKPWDPPVDGAREDLTRGGPVAVYDEFDTYTDSGAVGEPGAATAANGERFLEVFAEELAAVLRQVHERAAGVGERAD